MDICSFISARKLIFAHTMILQNDETLIKTLIKSRARKFNENIGVHIQNEHRSPLFEILKVGYNFGLYECLMRQIFGRQIFSKSEWKTMVWSRTWEVEENHWARMLVVHKKCDLLYETMENPRYLTWWYVADMLPHMMKTCEDMAKIVCGSSKLKSDVFKSKQDTFSKRVCTLCYQGVEENAKHLVMQCDIHEQMRYSMYNEIANLPEHIANRYERVEARDKYLTLMGKHITDMPMEDMIKFWQVSGTFISMMYRKAMRQNELNA